MWLLKDEVLFAMREARLAGYVPTAEERAAFRDAVIEAYAGKGVDSGRPRNMKVEGTRAHVSVFGVLTETPDCFAMLFGGGNTTYESIRESVRQANDNPDVKEIVLEVDSPGGSVHGLFETLDVLATSSKPIRVRAGLAASAAYAIAAVSGPIEAIGPASEFGSVGVVAKLVVDPRVVNVTSTEAPNKRPDVMTDEGKAVLREELDEIHALFVDYIARGRKRTLGEDADMSAAAVNAQFGRGSVYLAKKAKSRGMIDSMPRAAVWPSRETKNATADDSGGAVNTTGDSKSMNKDELKSKHPETYAAVFEDGKAAGVAEGKATEHKRAKAHIKLGKSAGAVEVALEAIESGASVQDDEVFAAYQAAGMKRREQSARQDDDKAASEAADKSKSSASGGSSTSKADSDAQVVADIVTGKRSAEVA